ncbi:MAG: hypothetical protein H3C50_03270 [Kiritimatiellae bacterium]|nr:hypothetical protein [Kiritimatiellia bacterium]MCO5067505.1 hypothetical protein [Kiritimatiellia bacterium]
MKQPDPSEITAALLRAAEGLTAIFGGLLLWLALWAGVLNIPTLERIGIPVSALPALLWLFGAWRLHRTPPLTPAWKSRAALLLLVAALQVYLLPYLGWWHKTPSELYRAINVALLMTASGAGFLALHLLALEIARYLDDPVLRIETFLSAISAALIVLLALGFLYWNLRRFGAEIGWKDYLLFYYQSSRAARASLVLLVLMPLLPPIALVWEVRQRILLWVPERAFPKNPA